MSARYKYAPIMILEKGEYVTFKYIFVNQNFHHKLYGGPALDNDSQTPPSPPSKRADHKIY